MNKLTDEAICITEQGKKLIETINIKLNIKPLYSDDDCSFIETKLDLNKLNFISQYLNDADTADELNKRINDVNQVGELLDWSIFSLSYALICMRKCKEEKCTFDINERVYE